MKKISRFIGKNITIDGIVGTIIQEKDDRTIISRFVVRNGQRIYSMRVAGRYLKYDNARGYYRIRNSYRSKVEATINEVHEHNIKQVYEQALDEELQKNCKIQIITEDLSN